MECASTPATIKSHRGGAIPFSEQEIATIREHYPTGGTKACLPFLPLRTIDSVRKKAQAIGLAAVKRRLVETDAWPPAAKELLAQLIGEGYSCSKVAERINVECGTTFTRNAIISKCHRMGLSMAHRPKISKPNYGGAGRPSQKSKVRRPDLTFDVAPGPAVDFWHLNNDTCREPIGGAGCETIYCGSPEADVLAGRPYCRLHHRINNRRGGTSSAGKKHRKMFIHVIEGARW